MKTINGDLIYLAKRGEFDLIAHGCNCHCNMGAGIARSIKIAFPPAYQADMETSEFPDCKLGSCSFLFSRISKIET